MSGHTRQSGAFSNWPDVLSSLAARGYVVASVEYRLSGEAPFPAAEQDVKAAIRWLRAHAATYGIDKSRGLIWGASAGGQLAALAATSCGVAALEPPAAPAALTAPAASATAGASSEPPARPSPAAADGKPAPSGAVPDESDCVQAAVTWYGVFDFGTLGAEGPAQRGPAQRDPAQRDPAQRGSAQGGPAQRDPAQRGSAQRGPAQHDAAQGDPAQGDPIQRGRARSAHNTTMEPNTTLEPNATPAPSGRPNAEERYLGCKPSECAPDVIAAASPITYVKPNSPPMLLVHGIADKTVPVKQSQEMYDKLRAAGVSAQLFLIPGVDHSFLGKTPEATRAASRAALTRAFQFVDATLNGASNAPHQ
jgi:acetyl esterase/lipase